MALLKWRGTRVEAIQLIDEAIQIADSTDLGKNTDVIAMRTGQAPLLTVTKQTDKAYEHTNKILELQRASLGEEHPNTMLTLHKLGML